MSGVSMSGIFFDLPHDAALLDLYPAVFLFDRIECRAPFSDISAKCDFVLAGSSRSDQLDPVSTFGAEK